MRIRSSAVQPCIFFKPWFVLLCFSSLSNFSTASLTFSEESYGNDSGLAVYVAKAIDSSLCWDDITWLKTHTHLPVIVKGVLNGTQIQNEPNLESPECKNLSTRLICE